MVTMLSRRVTRLVSRWCTTGVVVVVTVSLLLLLNCDPSLARPGGGDGCKAVMENKAWSGHCRNLTTNKDINFCASYVTLTDFDSCVFGSWSVAERDKNAERYYEEIKKYVIETGHYTYTLDISDFPLCTSALANYACSLYFPSCNGTECQSCPLLNTWLDTCLGQGAANNRLCDLNTWTLDPVPLDKRVCNCCQHNVVVDLTNFFEEDGTINRISQHTGTNLWVANHGIAISTCVLSVLGSTIIIVSFLIFRDRLRTFHLRLILYLSINDLFQAFLHGTDHAYNLGHGYVVPGRTCQAAGWWIGEFLVGNICWMICLVYYLHKTIVRQKKSHLPEWALIVICWGLPMYHIFPLIQFPNLSYGPRGNWCYIKDDEPAWQIVFLAVPTYLGFFITLFLYSHIVFAITKTAREVVQIDRKSVSSHGRGVARWRIQRRLLGYPVIFALQWCPLVIEFLLVWTHSSLYSITITDLFTVCFINLSGFMNCIWFIYNENLWKRYIRLFKGEGTKLPSELDSRVHTATGTSRNSAVSTNPSAHSAASLSTSNSRSGHSS